MVSSVRERRLAKEKENNKYIYEPLPTGKDTIWIRLLVVEPGEEEEPVSCLLTPFELENCVEVSESSKSPKAYPRLLSKAKGLFSSSRKTERAEKAGKQPDSQASDGYNALSYVWGEPSITKPILVHGKELKVTTNLEAALRRIRTPDQSQTLWVDAVCINQNDLDERNSQVLHMASIYRSAKLVAVWLGPGDEDSDYTFQLYKIGAEILRQVEKIEPSNRPGSDPTYAERIRQVDENNSEISPSLLQSFETLRNFPFRDRHIDSTLTQRAWFSRVWTVQEMLLARKLILICGSHSLAWEDVRICSDEEGRTRLGLSGLTHFSRYVVWKFDTQENDKTLSVALRFYGDKVCQDPRDKIYGLLGICRNSIVVPNYRLSVEKVYEETARAIIAEDGELGAVFFGPRLHKTRPEGRDLAALIPSWVPDFLHYTNSSERVQIGLGLENSSYRNDIGDISLSDVFSNPSPSILTLKAIIIGKLLRPQAKLDLTSVHWQEVVRSWEPLGMNDKDGYIPTFESKLEAYMRTLLLGQGDMDDGKTLSEFSGVMYMDHYRRWREMSFEDDLQHLSDEEREIAERGEANINKYLYLNRRLKLDNKFAMQLRLGIEGRVFCQVENQDYNEVPGDSPYFAMVTDDSVEGDVIVIARGSTLPIVLRRMDDALAVGVRHRRLLGENVGWKMIGTAYVHGLVSGDVWNRLTRRNKYSEQAIHLV